jgi:hypothetical protein
MAEPDDIAGWITGQAIMANGGTVQPLTAVSPTDKTQPREPTPTGDHPLDLRHLLEDREIARLNFL